jgi:hypothetical protein
MHQARADAALRQNLTINTAMEQPDNHHTRIPGWGVDANPKNDPTYPIKRRVESEHQGYTWQRPSQQAVNVEVLHSNERPNVSAVFGTSSPPSGLSGFLRRRAFRHSESSYGHWLPLMLADRINMVEGVVDDLLHGHVPNLCAELGWGAEWRYNRARFVRRLAFGTLIAAALITSLKRHD